MMMIRGLPFLISHAITSVGILRFLLSKGLAVAADADGPPALLHCILVMGTWVALGLFNAIYVVRVHWRGAGGEKGNPARVADSILLVGIFIMVHNVNAAILKNAFPGSLDGLPG